MEKVTGIGGVFFKARDPKLLMEWYEQHLGIKFRHGFSKFKWSDEQANQSAGSTAFTIFKEESAYFSPSEKPFMINFRVSDLRSLLTELRENGVTIAGDLEESDFGKFAWIVDPEGNKIELWEPV